MNMTPPVWDEITREAYARYRRCVQSAAPWERLAETQRQGWREALFGGAADSPSRALTATALK